MKNEANNGPTTPASVHKEARFLRVLVIAVLTVFGCADETKPAEDLGGDQSSSSSDASSTHAKPPSDSDDGADAGASKPTGSSMKKDAGSTSGKPLLDAGGSSGNPPTGAQDGAVSPSTPSNDDAAVSGGACDHACLIGYLEGYLSALVAHDPAPAKFSSKLRYTDNGKDAKLGDGLWKSATSVRADTRLLFADPMTGHAALQLVVLEGTTPVIFQARIKVEVGEITELETMTVRRQGAANGFFSPDGMVPKPVFLEPISADKRMTRDELKAEVELYVDFLEGESGSKVHFDPMCVRFENGQQTAQAGRVGSQSWSFDVTRRYLVFDEEQGIVWGMFPFTQSDSSLVVGEAFKVMDKKLMMIQAVMATIPAKTWM
jgi:hypothetical protein